MIPDGPCDHPLLLKQLVRNPLLRWLDQEIVYRDLRWMTYGELGQRISRLADADGCRVWRHSRYDGLGQQPTPRSAVRRADDGCGAADQQRPGCRRSSWPARSTTRARRLCWSTRISTTRSMPSGPISPVFDASSSCATGPVRERRHSTLSTRGWWRPGRTTRPPPISTRTPKLRRSTRVAPPACPRASASRTG